MRQWAGDIYTAILLIYRLHGERARRIQESSAMLWVQFYGIHGLTFPEFPELVCVCVGAD